MAASSGRYQRIKAGDKVCLLGSPSVRGIVTDVLEIEDGLCELKVFFHGGDERIVAVSDVRVVKGDILNPRFFRMNNRLIDLQRELLLAKVSSPYSEGLHSLHAARVEFHVYQFKPVLKFLRNPDQHLLIADEVGLGKTIEAGIIMTELEARMPLQRILVLCPASLRAKWQFEMQSRFDRPLQELDAEKLRKFLLDYQRYGTTPLHGIASIELIRREEFAVQLAEEKIQFDLVIIDEAHHCRNLNTRTNDVATILRENSDAFLMLTATPLQLGNDNLFNLLHILSPGEFDDFSTFEDRIEPNKYINLASVQLESGDYQHAFTTFKKVEATSEHLRFMRDPRYAEVKELLSGTSVSRNSAIKAQRMLLELNTISHIFTRTRKRDVVENAPIREARIITYSFTNEERGYYEAVVRFVREHWLWSSDKPYSVGFALVTRERQAASCIPAFSENFNQRMEHLFLDTEDLDMLDGLLETDEVARNGHFPPKLMEAAKELKLAKWNLNSKDTKLELLMSTLDEIFTQEPDAKVLIFSFFRATLAYLENKLRKAGISVSSMHGGVPVRKRQGIVEAFEDKEGAHVMLSSEVGSEGLDFQFCHIVINYDLPWNPMKVEQRIGRVDRFGQRSPKVMIYSFIAEGTIEDRIYARLYKRIQIFKESIGDLEAILGEEMRDLTKEIYQKELTPEQEIALADKAADRILHKKQELEEFEKTKLEFMGQDAIFNQDVREIIQSGRFTSANEIQALTTSYVEEAFPRTRLMRNQGEESWFLKFDDEFLHSMQGFLKNEWTGSQGSKLEFQQRVNKGQGMPITFLDDLAYERKRMEFINLRHPLSQAAILYWKKHESRANPPVLAVHISSDTQFRGDYFFFVYSIYTEAVRVTERLVSVVISAETLSIVDQLSSEFIRVVQQAKEIKDGAFGEFLEALYLQAQGIARAKAGRLRKETEREALKLNDALVNSRLTSLEETFKAKTRRTELRLAKVEEPRIVRMHKATLRNIKEGFNLDRIELENRRNVEVTYALKLSGLMTLHPDSRSGTESL